MICTIIIISKEQKPHRNEPRDHERIMRNVNNMAAIIFCQFTGNHFEFNCNKS